MESVRSPSPERGASARRSGVRQDLPFASLGGVTLDAAELSIVRFDPPGPVGVSSPEDPVSRMSRSSLSPFCAGGEGSILQAWTVLVPVRLASGRRRRHPRYLPEQSFVVVSAGSLPRSVGTAATCSSDRSRSQRGRACTRHDDCRRPDRPTRDVQTSIFAAFACRRIIFRGQKIYKTYEQLVLRIRDAIAAGELRPGDRLLPEAELAKHFGVSRLTIREGLKVLDLLESHTGPTGGTFVKRLV
jgi:hypothetical protein